VLDEVNVQKDPALADLRAGNFAGTSLLLKGHWMDVKERGGSLQIERVHRNAFDMRCDCYLPR
jgi:hypothetical protein